jgi:hypothetical protein
MSRARELAEIATAYDSGSPFGFRNRIINGQMMIDQRNAGASVSLSAGVQAFAVDRTYGYGTLASKFTVQQNAGSVTPPAGFINYLGATSASAYTVGAGEEFELGQRVEGLNISDLGWGTANAQAVTLSFWVRSSLTGTFGGSLRNSGGSRSYPFSYTVSSANTWEQKTINIAGDTSGTWLTTNGVGIILSWGLGVGSTFSGTAGSWAGANYVSATGATSVVGTSGATFYITGVQLEKGSTATSFDYRPYGTELALCQRYLPVFNIGNVASGFANGSNSAYISIPFPVSARTTPSGVTATDITGGSLYGSGGGNIAPTSLSWVIGGYDSAFIQIVCAGGLTSGNGTLFYTGVQKLFFTGCEL